MMLQPVTLVCLLCVLHAGGVHLLRELETHGDIPKHHNIKHRSHDHTHREHTNVQDSGHTGHTDIPERRRSVSPERYERANLDAYDPQNGSELQHMRNKWNMRDYEYRSYDGRTKPTGHIYRSEGEQLSSINDEQLGKYEDKRDTDEFIVPNVEEQGLSLDSDADPDSIKSDEHYLLNPDLPNQPPEYLPDQPPEYLPSLPPEYRSNRDTGNLRHRNRWGSLLRMGIDNPPSDNLPTQNYPALPGATESQYYEPSNDDLSLARPDTSDGDGWDLAGESVGLPGPYSQEIPDNRNASHRPEGFLQYRSPKYVEYGARSPQSGPKTSALVDDRKPAKSEDAAPVQASSIDDGTPAPLAELRMVDLPASEDPDMTAEPEAAVQAESAERQPGEEFIADPDNFEPDYVLPEFRELELPAVPESEDAEGEAEPEEMPEEASSSEPEAEDSNFNEELGLEVETVWEPAEEQVDPEPEGEHVLVEPEPEAEGEPESEAEPSSDPEAEAEVEPEPSSTTVGPQPAPESVPESIPESEAGAEPEAEGEPEGDSTPEPEIEDGKGAVPGVAEPRPEWDVAIPEWGPAWEVHIYGIGIAFAILAVYSALSIIRLSNHRNLLSKGYFISLNTIMLILGIVRAVFFLVDGYNARQTFHPVFAYFFFSIGFPCLTSAFSILFLALLQSSRMQLLSPKIQSARVLLVIVVCHFALSITSDIVVGYMVSAEIMLFVCQLMTILWGLLLFCAYVYIFRKLYVASVRRQKEMTRQMGSIGKLEEGTLVKKKPKLTLNLAIKVTMVTSFLGLVLACLQIYEVAGVYSIFSESQPEPWPWWVFNFCMRLVELSMAVTMSYVATQPFRYQRVEAGKKWVWSGLIYLSPCQRLCTCGDYESSVGSETHAESDVNDVDHVVAMTGVTNEVLTKAVLNDAADKKILELDLDLEEGDVEPVNSRVASASRPASLLVNDNGFIRFRQDGETGGEMVLSTDDDLDSSQNRGKNPFLYDLQKRGLVARNSDGDYYCVSGVHLPDQFGESSTDGECYYQALPRYEKHAKSMPTSGENTPATPRSLYSYDGNAGVWSYRPPSSIHLRESIENALNYPDFNLRTPDNIDSLENIPRGYVIYPGREKVSLLRRSRGSMSDLESLRSCHSPQPGYSSNVISGQCTPDDLASNCSMRSARSQLMRSHSDSLASIYHDPYFYPVERPAHNRRGNTLDPNADNKAQMQNLLRDINAMCTAAISDTEDDKPIPV